MLLRLVVIRIHQFHAWHLWRPWPCKVLPEEPGGHLTGSQRSALIKWTSPEGHRATQRTPGEPRGSQRHWEEAIEDLNKLYWVDYRIASVNWHDPDAFDMMQSSTLVRKMKHVHLILTTRCV